MLVVYKKENKLDFVPRMSSCSKVVLLVVLMVTMCRTTVAFAPKASLALKRGVTRHSHSTPPLTMAVVPPGVAAVVSAPIMYGLMSINEYMTHRWYQHAEISKVGWWRALRMPKVRGGGHVEHHAETLDDMSLKMDDKWKSTPAAKSLDSDRYRGTGFTWMTSFIMMIQMCISVVPIYTKVLGFTLTSTFTMLIPAMLLHALVWNALHPNMHGLPDMPLVEGAPSSWMAGLRNSAYFKFLYQNHEGHHVVGGQGNYNVCCPGTDHLVGTYIPEAKWRPRQDASIAKMNKPIDDPVLA